MYKQRNAFYDWSRVPLILDTTQAALLLQITPDRLAHLCKTGQFPAMRVGKAWRIGREAIRERLEGTPRRRTEDNMDKTQPAPLEEATSQEDPRPMYAGGNPIYG